MKAGLARMMSSVGVALTVLAMTGSLALARPVPPGADSSLAQEPTAAGPSAAPEAPWVQIERAVNPAHVRLFWGHFVEDEYYEVYRSPVPYFEPGVSPANRIQDISASGYGGGSTVEYIDDGIDRYAGDDTVGPVQVIGDVGNNYFWAVQGRTGGNTSGVINYVGEFDFALVKGA